MVNSRIILTNKLIINIGIICLIIICLLVCVIGYFVHQNKLLKTEINFTKTIVQQQAELKIIELEKQSDSLSLEISKKQKTIINNTFIYEQQNKNIGLLDSNNTDSLYRSNLRANYIKYQHYIK